jgi:hypothetical protein
MAKLVWYEVTSNLQLMNADVNGSPATSLFQKILWSGVAHREDGRV